MLSENIYPLNFHVESLPNMASDEGIDEAEQLRLLALQSMVRRSKPNKSDIKTNEKDDQDILLLRAAALKTIVHKNNSQNNLLVSKDGEPLKVRDLNGKRRYETSPSRRKKCLKLEKKMNNDYSYNGDLSIESYKESLENIKTKRNCMNKPEVENRIVANSNDNSKKIVKNGSMQLSNLDSEKIDETLVLHITFSSSDSDDSSSECDSKYLLKQKNKVRDSVRINTQQNVDDLTKTAELKQLEDKNDNVTEYMKKLTGLMKHCEAELKERNQQMTILLEAYEKYKNHSKTLCSIIQSMKTVRDELSKCCCVETDH